MQKKIIEQLKKIAYGQLNIPISEMHDDTKFHANLGMDSIDVVNFIQAINMTFDVKLSEHDVLDIETLQEMAEVIEKQLNPKHNA